MDFQLKHEILRILWQSCENHENAKNGKRDLAEKGSPPRAPYKNRFIYYTFVDTRRGLGWR